MQHFGLSGPQLSAAHEMQFGVGSVGSDISEKYRSSSHNISQRCEEENVRSAISVEVQQVFRGRIESLYGLQ